MVRRKKRGPSRYRPRSVGATGAQVSTSILEYSFSDCVSQKRFLLLLSEPLTQLYTHNQQIKSCSGLEFSIGFFYN